MGEGEPFQEGKRIKVSCTDCGQTMAKPSLCHHMEISHGIFLLEIRGVEIEGGRFRDLCGVLPEDFEVGGIPGGWLFGKGKQPREASITLNLLPLEGEGGNSSGWNKTTTEV